MLIFDAVGLQIRLSGKRGFFGGAEGLRDGEKVRKWEISN